jgi:cell division protein FtsB
VLFVVGGGFVLWVLLHSAVVMTRVVKQNTQLAQRVAMLETEIDDLKTANGHDVGMSEYDESVAKP